MATENNIVPLKKNSVGGENLDCVKDLYSIFRRDPS